MRWSDSFAPGQALMQASQTLHATFQMFGKVAETDECV